MGKRKKAVWIVTTCFMFVIAMIVSDGYPRQFFRKEAITDETVNSKPDAPETIPEKGLTENANHEDLNTEESNAAGPLLGIGANTSEDVSTENANSDDTNSENANPENANLNDTNQEGANPENANLNDTNQEGANPENANSENANSNEITENSQPEENTQDVSDAEVTETPIPTEAPIPTEIPWQYEYAVSNVTEFVNIRKEPTTDSAIVGKMYHNGYAKIVERLEEWTKIETKTVIGYVKNDYLLFDETAVKALQKAEGILVVINAGTVNLRNEPGLESTIIKEVKKGEKFIAEPKFDTEDWMAVKYQDGVAYLSKQFVTSEITFKRAVSKAEDDEIIAAAARAKALEEAKKYKPEYTNRKAVSLTDDELFLLSIVVEMEAGGESFEGKLAVANVVINRMLDGYWGKTLNEVVYAKGQFSGANSGRIERFSTRVSEESKKAAVAAAAGENNIGDYMFFIMNNIANYSSYKKYYILGCHCFYAR